MGCYFFGEYNTPTEPLLKALDILNKEATLKVNVLNFYNQWTFLLPGGYSLCDG